MSVIELPRRRGARSTAARTAAVDRAVRQQANQIENWRRQTLAGLARIDPDDTVADLINQAADTLLARGGSV